MRLNRQPKEDRDILLIKGCLKSRMISFLPDGTHRLKRHICSCEQCRVGKFDLCLKDIISVVYVEEESELDGLDEDNDQDADDHEGSTDERYEFVEVGCYIGLFSAPNSFEPFIVCEVKAKGVAEDDYVDFYGHVVKKGDHFITAVYLEESKRYKSRVFHKKTQENCFYSSC